MNKCELIQPGLALLVTIGFFCVIGYLIIHGLPQTGGDTLAVFLGSLGTAWTGIMAYYFGTTQGSKQKDQTIATMATGTGNSNTNQGV